MRMSISGCVYATAYLLVGFSLLQILGFTICNNFQLNFIVAENLGLSFQLFEALNKCWIASPERIPALAG